MEAVWLGSAFIFGLFAHRLGMPTLIGYLCAGFFIAAATPLLPIADPQTDTLSHIAHAGVLLLLFSVGLKLDVKQIVKPEIAGTGIAHMLFSVIIYAPIIHFVFGKNWETALLLSSALAFSSTVLAALVLESTRASSISWAYSNWHPYCPRLNRNGINECDGGRTALRMVTWPFTASTT